MKNFLYIFLTSVLSSQFIVLSSQTSVIIVDSVVELKEVNVSGERMHYMTTGHRIGKIDSTTMSRYSTSNIAEILSGQTAIYIKNYGIGSLSDLTIRGSSSQQNGVIWNGFNINSPSVNITDLSLIPGFLFTDIEILYGGGSAIFGNGLIGGGIVLKNNHQFNKKSSFNVSGSSGSYGVYSLMGKADVSDEKISTITAFAINSAKNDFKYINKYEFGKPSLRMKNAELRQYRLLHELSYKINKSQVIQTSLWYENSSREIPASLTMKESEAMQEDESLRSVIAWTKIKDKNMLSIKGGYFNNYLRYTDPATEIDSKIISGNAGINLENKRQLFRHTELATGANITVNYADAKLYYNVKNQNDGALFLSLQQHFLSNDWTAALIVRKQFEEGFKVPLTPSLGIDGKIWKFIYGSANVSQNFRSPTLNDRYWQPGGNPELKPEVSRNKEAGIIFKNCEFKSKNCIINTENSITVFSSATENWIQWIPHSSGLFSPMNIKEVWSRGLEIDSKTGLRRKEFDISLKLSYSYIKSTNVRRISASDNSYRKQLIYTPYHRSIANLDINYKNYNICYSQVYTGIRYTSSDNKSFLEGFMLGNLMVSRDISLWNYGITIKVDIYNIMNTDYEAIEYRVMPGRTFRMILDLRF